MKAEHVLFTKSVTLEKELGLMFEQVSVSPLKLDLFYFPFKGDAHFNAPLYLKQSLTKI